LLLPKSLLHKLGKTADDRSFHYRLGLQPSYRPSQLGLCPKEESRPTAWLTRATPTSKVTMRADAFVNDR